MIIEPLIGPHKVRTFPSFREAIIRRSYDKNLKHVCRQRVVKTLSETDLKQQQPVIDLAKSALDWEPKVVLEDGLKEMINYFKSVL